MIKTTNIGIIGAILAVVVYTGTVFYYGVSHGESSSSQTLATYVAAQEKAVIEALSAKVIAEEKLVQINDEHSKNLTKVREEYEINNANSDRAHTVRMQQLETRERSYRLMSQATDAERRALADTAAELDRTLTEGRQLVEELRREVALRNRQLEIIGEQIRAERSY